MSEQPTLQNQPKLKPNRVIQLQRESEMTIPVTMQTSTSKALHASLIFNKCAKPVKIKFWTMHRALKAVKTQTLVSKYLKCFGFTNLQICM